MLELLPSNHFSLDSITIRKSTNEENCIQNHSSFNVTKTLYESCALRISFLTSEYYTYPGGVTLLGVCVYIYVESFLKLSVIGLQVMSLQYLIGCSVYGI